MAVAVVVPGEELAAKRTGVGVAYLRRESNGIPVITVGGTPPVERKDTGIP